VFVCSSVADKQNQSPSRYLIPISFAAILGGMCTLIGTSTNLFLGGVKFIIHYSLFTILHSQLIILADTLVKIVNCQLRIVNG